MITHYYTATYIVHRIGTKWIHGLLERPGKKHIIDKILINDVSRGWKKGETYTINALHHDEPTRYGHNITITPLEVIECLSKA